MKRQDTRNYSKGSGFKPWSDYFRGGPVTDDDEDYSDPETRQDWKRDVEPELPQNRDKAIDRTPDDTIEYSKRKRLPNGPWRDDEA